VEAPPPDPPELPDSDGSWQSSPPTRIPLHGSQPSAQLQIDSAGDRVSLTVRSAPLSSVLSLLAQQHGLNIVSNETTDRPVSVTLSNVPLQDALDAILRVNGYTWTRKGDIIYVSQVGAQTLVDAEVQGRRLQVFQLDYVAAADVEKTVQGLLSPNGKAFIISSSPADRRRTGESIAVEDLPGVLRRVASYLAQVDHPPRQVLIEAQVLQIDLSDELEHGINFTNLGRLGDADLRVETVGLANPAATPAFLVGLDSTDLDSIIEALQTITTSKTLATPKVLAVNGQTARIQIGEQFGYFVTTTTKTSTLQNVEFLEVGVVLNVTPTISRDGQILMQVKPEVSNGRINPTSGLPEEETTEVETTVLLQDGKGMVIGGLIQETDRDSQSKVPVLGDIWGVGHLFRRKSTAKVRSEIIVALMPRVVPYCYDDQAREDFELEKVHTPLLENGLFRRDRTHLEPELPDAYLNPRRLSHERMKEFLPSLRGDRLHEPRYYWPTPSERNPFVDPYDRVIPEPIYNAPPEEFPYHPSEMPEAPTPNRPTLIAPPPASSRPYEPRS
jgi:type II secretory pathway component GspD/PulD (secretin)